MFLKNVKRNKGFTLTELMVSISVFAIVMVIATGSIFTIFDANRKSQNLRSVMDNLNSTLEVMTRTIRFGNTYHCDVTYLPLSDTRDCVGGASSISVNTSGGTQVLYRLNNGVIERSSNGGANYYALTSSDITITNLTFRVFGSPNYSTGDTFQPKVIIVVSGYVGAKPTTRSTFTIETTVSQRSIDS